MFVLRIDVRDVIVVTVSSFQFPVGPILTILIMCPVYSVHVWASPVEIPDTGERELETSYAESGDHGGCHCKTGSLKQSHHYTSCNSPWFKETKLRDEGSWIWTYFTLFWAS